MESIQNTVVLLIPQTEKWIVKWLKDNIGSTEGFAVIKGKEKYCALVYKDGAGGGDETPTAKKISNLCNEMVFSIWTGGEDVFNLHHFFRGNLVLSEYVDYYTFAEELGIQFIEGTYKDIIVPTSVCLVENIEMEVARTGLKSYLEELPWITIKSNSKGVYLHNPKGDISYDIFVFSSLFPENKIYGIRLANSVFSCVIIRGEEDLGFFFSPTQSQSNAFEDPDQLLESVLGERDPVKILKKLDIPAGLLGYN